MHRISWKHLCPDALHMLIAHSQGRTWRTPSLSVQVHSSVVVVPARPESMITCGVIWVSGSHSSHGSPFFTFFTLPCVPCVEKKNHILHGLAPLDPIGPPPSPLLLSASGQRRPAGQAVAEGLKYLSTDSRADVGWLRYKELQLSAALQHSVSWVWATHSYSMTGEVALTYFLSPFCKPSFLKVTCKRRNAPDAHGASISFRSLRSRSKFFKTRADKIRQNPCRTAWNSVMQQLAPRLHLQTAQR